MSMFKCFVLDESYNRYVITKYAATRYDVENYLNDKKYTIIKIKEKKESIINRVKYAYSKINSKDLSLFCKQLCVIQRAGITIVDGLEILELQTENKKFAGIIQEIHEFIMKGNSFSQSLRKYSNIFPEILINMIAAGEISGNIDVIMDRLSVYFEKEYKIKNKIRSAMTYPIILATVTAIVIAFLLINVVPTFVDMYTNSGVPLPAITVSMINISYRLKKHWFFLLFFILIFLILFTKINKIKNIRIMLDYLRMHIPIYNNLELKMCTARFIRTLAFVMQSGVSILQSLDTASDVIGNTYIKTKLLEVKDDIKGGLTLSMLLRRQKIFPPIVYSMIEVGEDTGNMEEILNKTADFFDEEVDSGIQRLTTMIEPAMIVIMAVIVGFIVLAMTVPMFDMIKIVQ